MGCTGAVVVLLFGLSIFIDPSEGVLSCIQCADLHNSTLEPFWKQAGGKVGCTGVRATRCQIGIQQQTTKYANLAAAAGYNDVATLNIPTSYGNEGEKSKPQARARVDDYAACTRLYRPIPSMATQMFMGCSFMRGPAEPCPAKIGCQSKSNFTEDFRPSRPSDMGLNVISCGCQADGCDPKLMYEFRQDDSMCGVDGLQGPLKITLFLGLLLASLL